jgi:hypothetical protein
MSQTTEALLAQISSQRAKLVREGGWQLHPGITERLRAPSLILCGCDPETFSLITYWLLRERYPIVAVVNDARAGEKVLRRTVLSSFELATCSLPETAIFLNCATHNYQAYQMFKKIADYRGYTIINPQQLAYICRRSGRSMMMTVDPEYYVEGATRDCDRILSMLPALDDEGYRQALLRVLLGRLTIDFTWFWSAYSPVDDMYFPNFFNYSRDEVLIDAGAFDGQDTLRFLSKQFYHFKDIYLFEIAPANLTKINAALTELDGIGLQKKIHVVPAGLWRETGELRFCGDSTSTMLSATVPPGNPSPLSGCPYRKSNPDILVIQLTENRPRYNPANSLHGTWDRRILAR